MRILAWPAFSNRKSNPYQARLYAELSRDHAVRDIHFKMRELPAVLSQRFDILHIHWLERVLWGSPRRIPVRILCFILFTWVLRLKGTRLVWTVHDPEPHSMAENERLSRGLLKILWPLYKKVAISSIDGLIFLSASHKARLFEQYPRLALAPYTVIPHSHYKGVYERGASRPDARRRTGLDGGEFGIVFIGKVRPYKNVENLIAAFREFPDTDARLIIAGEPDTAGYRRSLEDIGADDPRIRFALEFIADDQLQFYLHAADVAVMPFRDATNSGSVLLVLSFDCPVAVPNIPVFRELREIAGKEWVYLFDSPLSGKELAKIRSWATAKRRWPSPPLGELDWDQAAAETTSFYEVVRRGHPAGRLIGAVGR